MIALIAMHGLGAVAQAAEVESIGCESNQQCSGRAACEIIPDTPEPPRYTHCVLRNANGIAVFFDQEGTTQGDKWIPGGSWNRLAKIELTGAITKKKVAYVRQMFATYKATAGFYAGVRPEKFQVSIDSPGGDLYAAMDLGRMFRENRVLIELKGDDAQCASACIFAWVGAPLRKVTQDQPSFVIHRPYGFASAAQDLSEASNGWKMLQSDIRQYFLEMNVPPALLDAMNEVPSESGRELSSGELSRYLMTTNDPVITEITGAKESQKLGISRVEYLARKRRLDECAVHPDVGNNFCVKEQCAITTDSENIKFCTDFVTGPHAKENIDKLKRQSN